MLFSGVFGEVQNPLSRLSGQDRDLIGPGGLINLISSSVRLIVVVAGLFAFFNILFAGVSYITSGGDPKGIEAARQKILMSVVGLVIVAGTFIVTAIFSMIFYGRPDAILNPTIYGPTS